jgi:ketosteroid isomerase-like protein
MPAGGSAEILSNRTFAAVMLYIRRMSSASTLVREYLETWAERDLPRARQFLAEGFTMVYPGDARFTRLEDLVPHMAQRYRSVRKRFERFDEAPVEGGTAVYCFGTLYGEFNDGRKFEGVRFIDRFTVRDGKLVDHRVWNDLPR